MWLKNRISVCAVIFLCSLYATAQTRGKDTLLSQVRGQVFLPNGRPAGPGIQIQLLPGSGGVSQEVQTDSTGKFMFQALSPVRYTIRAHMTGFLDATEEFDMSVEASHYSHLTLRPDGAVSPAPPAGIVSVLPSDMPDSAKAEFNAGYEIVATGKDLGKAIPHLKKVTDSYPKYAPAYLLLGTAYARTDRLDDAIAPLQKAIQLDPKSADAYTVLGGIYNGQKKFPEAEQNLTKAVELAPTSFDAQYQLGRAYLAEQKAAEAQQHLDAALKTNPNSAEAHILMGNTMLRLRNAEGALKEYQEGVRLDPKGPMAEPAKQMIGKIQTALAAQKK
jgi:predicted Zn-dependent protease